MWLKILVVLALLALFTLTYRAQNPAPKQLPDARWTPVESLLPGASLLVVERTGAPT